MTEEEPNPPIAAWLKWHPFIKEMPFAKQVRFLSLQTEDALTGGNLGGGKSSSLLMAALQFMDVPGFSCLILRRKLTDLKMPGSLLDRAGQWLNKHKVDGLTFDGDTHTYSFPTYWYGSMEDARRGTLERNPGKYAKPGIPAKLTFGYIGDGRAEDRYRGTEFNRIIFDELTQHDRADFSYMFTRLRPTLCSLHGGEFQDWCWECHVRTFHNPDMRAATNPDNVGRAWVKEWYSIQPDGDVEEARKRGVYVTYSGRDPERPFISSSYRDNPYIDTESYESKLANMDPMRRDQLQYGQWDVIFASLYKRDWFKKYRLSRGNNTYSYDVLVDPISNVVKPKTIHPKDMMIVCTVDPAASAADGIAEDLLAGMEIDSETEATSSRTAVMVWGILPDKKIFALDLFVGRVEIPDIIKVLKTLDRKWRPNYFRIEKNGLGMGVFQYAKAEGLPVEGYSRRGGDKIVQATEGIRLAEMGYYYLPENADWMPSFATEVFNWVGHKEQLDDIVDNVSEIGHVVSKMTKFVSQQENASRRLGNGGSKVVFGTNGTSLNEQGMFLPTPPAFYSESSFAPRTHESW